MNRKILSRYKANLKLLKSRTGHWSVRDFNYLKIFSSGFSSDGQDACPTARRGDLRTTTLQRKSSSYLNKEAQEDYVVTTQTNEFYFWPAYDATSNDNRFYYRRRDSASFLFLRMILSLTSYANDPFGREQCIVCVPNEKIPVFCKMHPLCVTDLSFCITFRRERDSQSRSCRSFEFSKIFKIRKFSHHCRLVNRRRPSPPSLLLNNT